MYCDILHCDTETVFPVWSYVATYFEVFFFLRIEISAYVYAHIYQVL